MITDFDTRDRLRKAGYAGGLGITSHVEFDAAGNRTEQWALLLLEQRGCWKFEGPDLNVVTWLAEQHLTKEQKVPGTNSARLIARRPQPDQAL